ncbi:hypothetical protein E5288_WYG020627 [Bos mutus]|uniref:Protein FAM33A n=1 Tax=Bos mutus TaxID=72004 RepID=A0A6B0R3M0_9CETA|nr:hypothetical protein [Bos mutus]
MEAEVDKLELMKFTADKGSTLGPRLNKLCLLGLLRHYYIFQKADSDLDYIQYRLEYEIKTNYPDSAGKKNPVTLLKELSAIKSRYQTLHVRFKPIAVEQKETKSRICATFNKTMTLIQELQKETDLELLPLTEEEKTAAEQLRAHMSDL